MGGGLVRTGQPQGLLSGDEYCTSGDPGEGAHVGMIGRSGGCGSVGGSDAQQDLPRAG